ncbi:hypothetical protein [Hyalangium versicolor]|uniref:hypothetical protein n=1 Tax=Hyalangium versicolor TaxID=2861190 RepID=UPI001CCDF937|nr:hypothetical protein [Hyalangium versicolor]
MTTWGGLAMLGLLVGCATAAPPTQTPAATTQGAQKDQAAVADASKDSDNALVCEEVPVTGSHIPRRICRTRRQIKQEKEQAQKSLQSPERANRKIDN